MVDMKSRIGFSVKELAGVLGISKATIYEEIKKGSLKSIKIGKGTKNIILKSHIVSRFGGDVGSSIVEGLND